MKDIETNLDRTWTVPVGYHGQQVPVRFNGALVFDCTNKEPEGSNSEEYHKWTLFKTHRGFRVMDIYTRHRHSFDRTTGERVALETIQHIQLSKELDGGELSFHYPKVVNDALKEGTLQEEEVVLSASTRDRLLREQEEKEREDMEREEWRY
jgi:hypothetical protein